MKTAIKIAIVIVLLAMAAWMGRWAARSFDDNYYAARVNNEQ